MDEQNDNLPDLAEPAQRAASIVAEHVNSVIDAADRQAHEVLRDAERDAEATRREALESAQRVFERIEELERPLREFVQNLQLETDRVERELAGDVDAEATSIASGSGSAKAALAQGRVTAIEKPVSADPVEEQVAEPVEAPVDEPVGKLDEKPPLDEAVEKPVEEPDAKERVEKGPATKTVADEPESAEKKPSPGKRRGRNKRPPKPQAEHSIEAGGVAANGDEKAAEQPATDSTVPVVGGDTPEVKEPTPTPISPTVESGPGKLASRLLGRLRDGDAGKGAFITTEGHCSVCQKTFMAGSEADLKQSGWKVNGDVGLCPQCQSDAWQLPEGARLPFRRGGG